ncbi:MAG TPA: LacI family DNA-binding transcriptional regulator [Chloroflexia bacterium]|nr:LacI family DNA-binding transcriptional regulator [Chloroflexia bacterium]
MAVTIHDVARTAGVGIGTVSRVLNNNQAVKESTRQKVLDAIAQLEYHPDPIARSMITRRTGVAGVVIPFITRGFSVEVLRGLINTAGHIGYELVIYNLEDDIHSKILFSNLPMRRKVDGLLMVSLVPDEKMTPVILKSHLPVVLIDAYSPYFTSIIVNNIEGAYQAVKSLLKVGHRRIGFINGIKEGNFKFNQANDRLIGVHRALAEAGIEFDPDLMAVSDWTREGGQEAAEKLLSLPEPPTAIFASSDIQAVGVLEVARKKHLKVPRDLSIIGFDGIDLSEILDINTVQQPMEKMGELGMNKLLELLENENNKLPELIRLDTCLLERHTVAPPARNKKLR